MSPQEPPKEPPPCEKPLLEACADRVPRRPTRAFAKTAEPGKPVSQGVKDHLATSDPHGDPTTANRRIPSPAHRLTAGRMLTGLQQLRDAGRPEAQARAAHAA